MSENGDVFPLPLPVVVVTGEYESGKTLAILTTGYPLDRTLIYDNEESATLYERRGQFKRVDLMTELGEKHPGGWTNLQFYEAWRDHMRAIKPGEYDVIGVDPIERVESGLSDWVRQNPSHFGHTAGQYSQMAGLFWGDMKDQWGRHILEMKARCRMVILTAHMRDVWKGKQPVPGQRQRKGKETLSEFATLEITLVRKEGQIVPSAKVDKTRLVFGDLANPSTLRPMFDPWIETFTWEKVRWYMEHGTDPNDLKTEPPPDPEQLAMEKLRLEAKLAEEKAAERERVEAITSDLTEALAGVNGPEEFWQWVSLMGLDELDIRAYLTEKHKKLDGRSVKTYIKDVWELHQTTAKLPEEAAAG